MTFPERLTAAFKELEKEHQLEELTIDIIPDSYRFVVVITSESFEKIPDYVRQNLVWGKVLEKFNDSEQRLVEFIDTPAPSDKGEEKAFVKPTKKRRSKPAKRR
jgi:hypothetical protein